MQTRDKIGCILYDRGGKPGSNYPEPGPGTQFQLQITNLIVSRIATFSSNIGVTLKYGIGILQGH